MKTTVAVALTEHTLVWVALALVDTLNIYTVISAKMM